MAILIDGTVPVAREAVYTVSEPDFKTDVFNFDRVNVTKITLFNNILTQQTVILYVQKQFGELRKLRQYVLKLNESAEYLEGGEFLPLRAGDELHAETTTTDAVDFVVYGDIE
jgi:hypothetical protein